MGTSASSGGPAGGVPLVPPWADTPPEEAPHGDSPPEQDGTPAVPETAPPARFQQTRRNLGDFARTADRHSLSQALGSYVRHGYGGAAYTARRMQGTARTAAALGSVLSGFTGAGAPGQPRIDRGLVEGRTVDEVMDAVIEAVRPVDGTQDAEASRKSVRDALSELLKRFPDADLLALDEMQRDFVIERFVALDAFLRFDLDVGKVILDKAPSVVAGLARLKDAKNFIVEAISAAFRRLRESGRKLTGGQISRITALALQDTYTVFEGNLR